MRLCSLAYDARAASRGLGSAFAVGNGVVVVVVVVVGVECGSGEIGSIFVRSLQTQHNHPINQK